ncbi:hypothetical protein [Kocuria sp.]|uniref:hypothetical protein n=1 Tax=Kocuria sp. TaxID=1871328 RepID=UPI0026DA7072|nr:hypothetical protein [Kocuria sp.]MDO4919914.1 hypothetical protein [Kocuria sp.]
MLDQQRVQLTRAVAVLLDEDAATVPNLEHQRVLYGATRAELVEILHGLDTQAAHDYEETT